MLVAAAAFAIIAGLGGNWLFRELLIRALRARHPREFAELGAPSSRDIYSVMPRHHEMQIRFWRFVWGGSVFRLGDRTVTGLAAALVVSSVILAVGVALLAWAVAQHAANSPDPGGTARD